MTHSLQWLPPDAPQDASCSWTDAKAWALLLGGLVTVFIAGPLVSAGWPLRAGGMAVGVLGAVYCARVALARVTVGPNGVRVRGITSSRFLPWTAVRAIETRSGPVWLSVVSGRPWQPRKRVTRRLSTSTVLCLSDGSTLRPLVLTRSLPSRAAEDVTRLAEQFVGR